MFNQLNGSMQIVFDEICRMLVEDERITYDTLADASGLDRRTVARAVRGLQRIGLLQLERHDNGNWRYIVRGNDEMIAELARSICNMIRMTPYQRWERITMALMANRIYEDAKRLRKRIRDRNDNLACEIMQYLEQVGAMRLMTTWPQEKAVEIQSQIDAYFEQLEAENE